MQALSIRSEVAVKPLEPLEWYYRELVVDLESGPENG